MKTNSEDEDNGGVAGAQEETPSLHECLAGITKEIHELKKDMKNDLVAFKKELNTNFRQQFANFKEDVNKKLQANNDELQEQKRNFSKAQARIKELESFNMEVKEALLTTLSELRKLQEKVTDLEGRSRRNNVRIFGVPEGAEGESVPHFVEELLRRELALPEGTSLLIQRAHRAAAKRPGPGETPRSIIVNLRFDTKEMILKQAWQKRIKLNNVPLFFDYDY